MERSFDALRNVVEDPAVKENVKDVAALCATPCTTRSLRLGSAIDGAVMGTTAIDAMAHERPLFAAAPQP